MEPFAYRRALWAFDWRLQAERTIEAVADRLLAHGCTALHQEVYYGMRWQGEIDKLSVAGPNTVVHYRSYLASRGIVFVPVFVPRGQDAAGEIAAYAEVINLCGCGVIDLEWDSSGDYWQASGDAIAPYMAELRRRTPGAVIGWQPDARVADPGRGREWELMAQNVAPFVDAFLPQLYAGWGVYGRGDLGVNADLRRLERWIALGHTIRPRVLPVYPTLYIAEGLDEPRRVWEWAQHIGCTGLVGFRLGAANLAALDMVAALPLPDAPAPEPKPEPTPEPKPEPTPEPTLAEVKLGLIAKIIAEQWDELATDALKLGRVVA